MKAADTLHIRGGLGQARRWWNELLWRVTPRRIWEARLNSLNLRWVFVCGCNNSGTTLLAELLAAHPGIQDLPGEGQFRSAALLSDRDAGVGRLFSERMDLFRWTEAKAPQVDVVRLKYDWLNCYRSLEGYLLEKTPANSLKMRWLEKNFEPAWFIGVVRSPLAVCEGIKRRTGVSVDRSARHWQRVNRTMFSDSRRVHRFILVNYSELTRDPESSLDRVRSFLSLDLPFHVDRERKIDVHNIYGEPRAIEDLDSRSVERLTAEEVRAVRRICGPMMEELGLS